MSVVGSSIWLFEFLILQGWSRMECDIFDLRNDSSNRSRISTASVQRFFGPKAWDGVSIPGMSHHTMLVVHSFPEVRIVVNPNEDERYVALTVPNDK